MQTITAAEDSEMILAPNVPVLEKTQKKVTTLYSDFTLTEDLIKLLESKVEVIIGYCRVGRARVEAKNIGFGRVGQTVRNLGRVRVEKLGPKRPET
jgi:hypothetical protein